MPREIQPTKTPGTKKSPMGIPAWGWIAAIAIGLLIGYFALRKSSTGLVEDSGNSGTNPLGSSSGNSGGGGVASPSPDTSHIIPSTLTDQGTVSSPSGDSSLSTSAYSSTASTSPTYSSSFFDPNNFISAGPISPTSTITPTSSPSMISAGPISGGSGGITIPTNQELSYQLLTNNVVSAQQQQAALQQQLTAARQTHSGFARIASA